jgi:glycosyltransferase involved in cell wall biosynthesis
VVVGETVIKTTLVVPVWDSYVQEFLPAALASLRGQDGPKQILVVDNASASQLTDLEGVQVVRTSERLSVGATRNFGLEQVTTPYVMFWDADDTMLPGTLGWLERAMAADPRLVAIALAIVEEGSGARHRWPRRWMPQLGRWPSAFALLDCLWSLYPSTGATIMSTEAVREAGGYCDADSGEDWCLGVSLAFRGPIGWDERPGRIYRIHEGSVWARHMGVTDQLDHARAVRERIRVDPGIPERARMALPGILVGQYAAIALHAAIAAGRRWSRRNRAGR